MNEHQITAKLMGSMFTLKIVCDDEARADRLLNEAIDEIRRIEALLSEFDERSVTSELNQNAGTRAVQVPSEVYQLIVRALHISRLTQGAFDITVGPLKRLYDFRNGAQKFPDSKRISDAMACVGYRHIIAPEENTIFLERTGMRISFAAIGKGYAADRVKQLWQSEAIEGGVINASGDLTVLGRNGRSEPWMGGIAHPDRPGEVLLCFPLDNRSMATSGDYVQFFHRDGIRYSHNIDPRTGMPTSGIKSVSVIAGSAEMCDALATAVFVMGAEVGLHLVNQLPAVHCLVVDDNNVIHQSHGVRREHAMVV